MTKRPFLPKGSRSNDLLVLVHIGVCSPINIRAHSGYKYFITFTDDHSRYRYVNLMHHNFESFEKSKEYRAEVKSQLGQPIKAIRSDEVASVYRISLLTTLYKMRFCLNCLHVGCLNRMV